MAIHDTPDVLKAGKILFDKAEGDTDYDKWNTQIFIVTPEESREIGISVSGKVQTSINTARK